jgi:hypothetical protein
MRFRPDYILPPNPAISAFCFLLSAFSGFVSMPYLCASVSICGSKARSKYFGKEIDPGLRFCEIVATHGNW